VIRTIPISSLPDSQPTLMDASSVGNVLFPVLRSAQRCGGLLVLVDIWCSSNRVIKPERSLVTDT